MAVVGRSSLIGGTIAELRVNKSDPNFCPQSPQTSGRCHGVTVSLMPEFRFKHIWVSYKYKAGGYKKLPRRNVIHLRLTEDTRLYFRGLLVLRRPVDRLPRHDVRHFAL